MRQWLQLLNTAWLLAPLIGMIIVIVGFYVRTWSWEEKGVYPDEHAGRRLTAGLADFQRRLSKGGQEAGDAQSVGLATDAFQKRPVPTLQAKRDRLAHGPIERSTRHRRIAA